MRRNFLNVEDMYETRNIRSEEVYIEAKIRSYNAGRGMKHDYMGRRNLARLSDEIMMHKLYVKKKTKKNKRKLMGAKSIRFKYERNQQITNLRQQNVLF